VGFNADIEIGRVAAFRRGGAAVPAARGITAERRPRRSGASLRRADRQEDGVEIGILRVELVLGIWIGAVTFTGSVVAYGKLAGNSSLLPFKIDTAAKQLPGGHMLNAARRRCLGCCC
jgi:NAD(P) transhydrogenase subunit beta